MSSDILRKGAMSDKQTCAPLLRTRYFCADISERQANLYLLRKSDMSAAPTRYVLGTAKSISESVPCRSGRDIFARIYVSVKRTLLPRKSEMCS